MLSCSLATCGMLYAACTQQLSTGPGRKNKGEEGLVNLLILSRAQSQDCLPVLVPVGVVQTLHTLRGDEANLMP